MSSGYQISEVSSPAGLPRIFIQIQHTVAVDPYGSYYNSADDGNEEEIFGTIAKY